MLLSDYHYNLPDGLIAQHPHEPRDHSRLMVLNRTTGEVSHQHFYNVPDYLEPGDTLVFNNTRVIPARLIGTRADTGGKVEVFLLNRLNHNEWETLVKPGKRARPGTTISFGEELSCEILDSTEFGGRVVRFTFQGAFEAILDRLGETIRRFIPVKVVRQLHQQQDCILRKKCWKTLNKEELILPLSRSISVWGHFALLVCLILRSMLCIGSITLFLLKQRKSLIRRKKKGTG